MSRNEEFARYMSERDWYHGTDEPSIQSLDRRQYADFRGIQVHGPGFYITPRFEHAEQYARDRAEHSGSQPVVQSGWPVTNSPVQMTHRGLTMLGQQFREEHPHVSGMLHDAALGNISLRQRGHDFLHVIEGVYGDPIDVGVILRPDRWVPDTDHYVPEEEYEGRRL